MSPAGTPADAGAEAPDADASGASSGHCCYAAAIENRAKEVGVAVLDVPSMSLRISQHIEPGRSYTTTQLLLDACAPQQVVLVGSTHHEVSLSGGLNHAISAGWDHVLLPRSCFDDTKGILAVQDATGWAPDAGVSGAAAAAAGAGAPTAVAGSRALLKSHYLAFGAAGALLHHLKANLRLVLTPHALQVAFEGVKHHMAMDREVVASLELLAPGRARSALQKAVAKTSASAAAAAAASRQHKDGGPAGSAAADDGDGVEGTAAYGRGGRRGWCGWRRQERQPGVLPPNKRSASLFGFLDHTATVCGARLLRTNLLQPLTDVSTLELRLDSLQELLESPHLSLELVGLMDMLPKNLDKVCSNLAIRPSSGSAGGSANTSAGRDLSVVLGRLVSSVILLRDVLRCLPAIVDSMAWVDSQLLRAIRANLANGELQELLRQVEAVLDDDAQASKTAFVNRVQQCYAVRAQVDSFLDLSRSTFSRLTEAIHELAAQYREATGIPGLRVQYSASKGFFLLVPTGAGMAGGRSTGSAASSSRQQQQGFGAGGGAHGGSAAALPKSFLVLEKRGRATTCVTTHELNALNSRLRDAAADCMLLTVQVLEALVGRLLSRMPLLLRVLDNIALLDMLLAFFQAVGGSDGDYCRPSFSASGPLAVTRGRHPLLLAAASSSASSRRCVANDVYVSAAATLHLVTGPNMSGKSTYLKQVALLVVMAQVGCYVPAAAMALAPYASLHTRLGTSDAIEANASSFMVEVADMVHVMERAGPRSLVLVDELGRATSTSDGAALCWAMAEYLLALGAHTLLATHFRQMDELSAIYPTVRLWRMQVGISACDIDFKWSIAAGAPPSSHTGGSTAPATAAAAGTDADAAAAGSHYGVLLARMAGLPGSICDAALRIAQQLEDRQQRPRQQQQQGGGSEGSGPDGAQARLQQVYLLVNKLGCVAREAAAAGGLPPGGDSTDAAAAAAGGKQQDEALAPYVPLLAVLKRQAERLLLEAAAQPAAVEG